VLTAPTSFASALEYFASKAAMPTGLSAMDFALRTPVEIRRTAFWSAKVASANILQALKDEVELFAAGTVDLATARARMKLFLERQGYGVPDLGSTQDRNVQTLASTRRLELIIRQNAKMAQATASRAVEDDPAVEEFLPNRRFRANTDRHGQWNGWVLSKRDPFWKTHYPPVDYNCECWTEDTDDPVTHGVTGETKKPDGTRGLTLRGPRGQTVEIEPNPSGYSFYSAGAEAPPPAERIEDVELRAKARREEARRGLAERTDATDATDRRTIGPRDGFAG
jgi:hypothetical protein